MPPNYWFITLVAASTMMITMGARQSLGLFVSPLNTTTGLGFANISLAMAVAQSCGARCSRLREPTGMARAV